MPSFKDLSGRTFGKVSVTSQHRFDGRSTWWFVYCMCGREWWVRQPDRLKGCRKCSAHKSDSPLSPAERQRRYRLKHHGAELAQRRVWYQKNRDKQREAAQRWAASHKDAIRHRRFEKRYGLTKGQYDGILASQNGACAICGVDLTTVAHGAQVDHDHITGKVRGFLCILCNTGLGKFKDNPIVMRKAIQYVEDLRVQPKW